MQQILRNMSSYKAPGKDGILLMSSNFFLNTFKTIIDTFLMNAFIINVFPNVGNMLSLLSFIRKEIKEIQIIIDQSIFFKQHTNYSLLF